MFDSCLLGIGVGWCVGGVSGIIISFACYGLFSLRSFRGTCLSVGVWRYFSLCFVVCLILRSILFPSKCILIHSDYTSFLCMGIRHVIVLGLVVMELA